MAGTIAAVGNNAVGVIGVAPKAKFLAAKGLSSNGAGTSSSLAAGIYYAANEGALVINNSWGCVGGCKSNPVAEDAVRYANGLGSLVVFAAGNDNADVSNYSPQNIPESFVVSAFDQNDVKASFSNFGSNVAVAAPGVGILSTTPNNTYSILNGTSMAAPHASGLAALVFSVNPLLSNEDVRNIIELSADDVDVPGKDTHSGYGRINAFKAAQMAQTYPPGNIPPRVVIKNFTLTEKTGNLNHELEAGESFYLNLELLNGRKPVTNIKTSLSSTSQLVAITKGTALYGDFSPSQSKQTSFEFSLSPQITPGTDVSLTVNITADGGFSQTYNLDLGSVITTERTGWPFKTIENLISDLTVGDIDKDLQDEILVTPNYGILGNYYQLKPDGTAKPGWPKMNLLGGGVIALGDLENNNQLDIVSSTHQGGQLLAMHPDGTPLKNWPINIPEGGISSPAIADLNHDGILKTIVPSYKPLYGGPVNPTNPLVDYKLYVFNPDASMPSGWPHVFPTMKYKYTLDKDIDSPSVMANVAVGDLDHNGDLEIVVTTWFSDGILLHVLKYNGEEMAGWPQFIRGIYYTNAPIIADLDGDGNNEIIIGGVFNTDYSGGSIYVFRNDGRLFPGWPVTNASQFNPVIGDIDDDGYLEIVSSYYSQLSVYRYNGQVAAGWPKSLSPSWPSEVRIADVNGDGKKDIIGAVGNSVMAWNFDGSAIAGWPKIAGSAQTIASLSIADIDHNGTTELIADSNNLSGTGEINVWDLNVPYDSNRVDWGTKYFNAQRNNYYNKIRSVKKNQAPIVNPVALQTTTEGQLLSVSLTATDPENQPITFRAENLPPGAVFDPTTKKLTWTPQSGQAGVYRNIRIIASDGQTESAIVPTVVVFSPTENFKFIALAPTMTIVEDTSTVFPVMAVDRQGHNINISIDGGYLPFFAYFVPVASGAGWNSSLFGWSPRYSPAGPAPGQYTVTFKASNGIETKTQSVLITVITKQTVPPIANAGPDQTVNQGDWVILDGSGSTDPNGVWLTYSWAQLGEPVVQLMNASTANPNFIAPQVTATTNLTFVLTVSNGSASATDSVTITVNHINHPPIAKTNLGYLPITLPAIFPFTMGFSGSGSSDPDGDPLTYIWNFGDGSASASGIYVTHTFTKYGIYPVTLTVSDGVLSSTASVQITLTNLPDLLPSVSVSAKTTVPGSNLPTTNSIFNLGVTATGPFVVSFHLSRDIAYGGTDDIPLATTRSISSLNGGAINTDTTSLAIPATTPVGNYYVCAMADSGSVVTEFNEQNNSSCSATTIRVDFPDLVMTSLSGPTSATKGTAISLANTVKNQGGSDAGNFTIRYYLSSDTTITTSDTLLGSRTVSSLAAGAVNTATTTVTIPSTLSAGTYYLGAIADYNNALTESNENNNALTGNTVKVQ